jgi:hypothetical protein
MQVKQNVRRSRFAREENIGKVSMDINYREYAEKALKYTNDIIQKTGSRVSGTDGNKNAVNEILNIIKNLGIPVFTEEFDIYPQSLFAIGKVFSSLYVIAIVGILIHNRTISILVFLLLSIGIVYFISQFILYLSVFDRLFPKGKGQNIISTIEPKEIVKQQIVIVGHHDSSPIYPFHEKYPTIFSFRLVLAILFYFYSYIVTARDAVFSVENNHAVFVVCLVGLIFTIPMYFYMSKKGSLGAGDNLIGCTIGIELLEILCRYEFLDTRIILLLTDGEEVGQKGAVDYIKRHYNKLNKVPTKVINIDTIYKKEDLLILASDRNGITKLDKEMAIEVKNIAQKNGFNIKIKPMPFLGGGTDGGQFARKGLKTISLIGLPISFIRKEILIHTCNDIPSRINVEAIEAVISTIVNYVKEQKNQEKCV